MLTHSRRNRQRCPSCRALNDLDVARCRICTGFLTDPSRHLERDAAAGAAGAGEAPEELELFGDGYKSVTVRQQPQKADLSWNAALMVAVIAVLLLVAARMAF